MTDTPWTVIEIDKDGLVELDGKKTGHIDVDAFLKEPKNKAFIEAFEIAGHVRPPFNLEELSEGQPVPSSFERERLIKEAADFCSEHHETFGQNLYALLAKAKCSFEDSKPGPLCLKLFGLAKDIPWEYLQKGNLPIAGTHGIVRIVPGEPEAKPPTGDRKLSVLFACAAPLMLKPEQTEEEAAASLDPLDVHGRIQYLEGQKLKLELRLVPFATRLSLLEGLDGNPAVFHFDGHGSERGLALEKENWCLDTLPNDEIQAYLTNGGIRIAVFEACLSAQAPSAQIGVVAPSCHISSCDAALKAGLLGVVAMRASISVSAADEFSKAFYGALARGCTPLEATKHARTSMKASHQAEHRGRGYEWGIPGVYCHEDSLGSLYSSGFKSCEPAVRYIRKPARLVNVPNREQNFVGRRKELVKIAALIQQGHKTLLLGQRGVGKTTAAVEAARRFSCIGRFKEVTWASARSKHEGEHAADLTGGLQIISDKPEESLFGWLARGIFGAKCTTGDPEKQKDALINFFERDRSPRLLLLDNLESLRESDLLARFISALPPHVSVLATATEAPGGIRWKRINIPSLPEQDMARLLAQESISGLTTGSPLFWRVVKAVAGNGMVLRTFVRYAESEPESLEDVVKHMENLEGDVPKLYEYIFGKFFGTLTEPQTRAFGTICMLEPVAPRKLVEGISGFSANQLTKVLGSLGREMWTNRGPQGAIAYMPFELTRREMLTRLDGQMKLRDELRDQTTSILLDALKGHAEMEEVARSSLFMLAINWMKERKIEPAYHIWESLYESSGEKVSDYRSALVAGNLTCCLNDLPASTEDRINNLNRRIDLLSSVLSFMDRDRYPEDWARTQSNLGAAHSDLPSATVEERAANLEEALKCFRAALKVYQRDRYPEHWAAVQNNLGETYLVLPSSSSQERAKNLRQAIRCCLAALEVRKKDHYPKEWAMTKNNLAGAYCALPTSGRQELAANMNEAVRCLRAALKVFQKQDYPEGWAMTQNNLGEAYRVLPASSPQGRAKNLRKAIKCYRAALEVYQKDRYPEEWAGAQNNLGIAYRNLPASTPEESGSNLREAIACYQAALEVYQKDRYPEYWAATQNNLGGAHSRLADGAVEEREANSAKAVVFYCAALEVYRPDSYPHYWCHTMHNLGLLSLRMKHIEAGMKCIAGAYTHRQFLPDQGTQLAGLFEKIGLMIDDFIADLDSKHGGQDWINELP
ncbi:MAG TPA: CHAT domain-containing protein [bacterium]|nr:CHAT domain-containing protein [bacterium]